MAVRPPRRFLALALLAVAALVASCGGDGEAGPPDTIDPATSTTTTWVTEGGATVSAAEPGLDADLPASEDLCEAWRGADDREVESLRGAFELLPPELEATAEEILDLTEQYNAVAAEVTDDNEITAEWQAAVDELTAAISDPVLVLQRHLFENCADVDDPAFFTDCPDGAVVRFGEELTEGVSSLDAFVEQAVEGSDIEISAVLVATQNPIPIGDVSPGGADHVWLALKDASGATVRVAEGEDSGAGWERAGTRYCESADEAAVEE